MKAGYGCTMTAWLCLVGFIFAVSLDPRSLFPSVPLFLIAEGAGVAALVRGEEPRAMIVVPMVLTLALPIFAVLAQK